MSTRASLSGTSENVEPETAVNHDVSGCEVGRPREKSTLSDTSQNEEENGPSKRHCLAQRVTVIKPVVRVARLPDNLIASICGLQNRGVQSNVHNNASREGIAAVGIEYKDSECIEQCSEESMDWDAQLISERESTDTEAEGEGERSASTKICAYDTSSEDSDLECETPVLTIDLEATCSDSVSLSLNKETSERDGTSENIGENLSPPCLPTRKRGEENDADAAANVSPSKETRRIGQNTNTEPVTEESPEGRRFTERSHDQERGNGRQVVDASVRRRRKPVPFSQLEEEAIFFGFSKYWQDSMTWKKIHVKGGFVGRTTSDLRDKYRNLQRNSFAYNSVKKRVSKKREQKINPLKELQKHNEHNRRSMEDRCTIVRYSILVSSRLGNDASTSSYIPSDDSDVTSDDSDSASDDIVVLEECVRESEPRSNRESLRGSLNSTESSQGQEILEDPCYAETAETPPVVTASTTRGSASSTPGQATVTQADVGDSNNDSGVQDSFIEDGTPPVVERMERTGVATYSQTKRKCFCDAEVEALVYGVLKHGRGNWSVIKQLGGFHDRSSTDLSDKYRNLERSVERMSRLKDKVREQERVGKDPLQNWKRRNVQI
ncbi:uncharacterized protein LOC135367345 [Ornithodoros turicata]|uniref:uncharacterized protein LOC135367345 n=1 Tax=Ornithodoros turicata TaxID=34597 RepID=UPI003138FD00